MLICGPFLLKNRNQLILMMWLYLLLITMWYLFDGCILNVLDKGDPVPNCSGTQPNSFAMEKLSKWTNIDIDTVNDIGKLFPIVMSTIVMYKVL